MITIRRTEHEARIEIMPMIDVIFLLLTFFIYAMVLMIRAELLPVQMQQFASGEPAQPAPAVTISIDRTGALYVDRQPIAMEHIVEHLEAAQADDPETVIYIAAEEAGDTDRLPTFLSLYDRLALAGLDIRLVGRPSEEDEVPPRQE
ncbi:MAG: biopolymer transporter ExbD [Planctomycetota bacterium]|nr:biopolymer transporter ExbD [Planctomycetota bacterium]